MIKETHLKREKGEPTKGKTDYERLKKMTEEEIEENAKSDPDAPLLTAYELKKFKKIKPEEKQNGKEDNQTTSKGAKACR